MQGECEALTGTEKISHAYEYKYLTDSLQPLKNPVGEDITYDGQPGQLFTHSTVQAEWLKNHVLGSACYGHTNLVPEFCRAYIKTTGQEVLAVHAAKGSTEIIDWLPGSAGYEMLVKKTRAAERKVDVEQKQGRVFFVWLQGESDAIVGRSKACYKEKIAELCAALKKDIGMEIFGIIRVGRFTNDERDDEIIAAQDEICLEQADFLMLTEIATELNAQSEYMNPYVGGHYSAKGLEKLGF